MNKNLKEIDILTLLIIRPKSCSGKSLYIPVINIGINCIA